jgi:hypothetical protein
VVDPNARDDPGTECQLGAHTIKNQDSLPERRAALRARDVLSDMVDNEWTDSSAVHAQMQVVHSIEI